MRSFRNTFRHRTSDQRDSDGDSKYLRSFASDVIDLLPPDPLDRLLVIRSAPGAGKTSLLRAFEPATLLAVASDPAEYADLSERLTDVKAIGPNGVAVLGARISMRSDFRDLVDLGLSEDGARKLFFRFVDAQVLMGVLRSIIELAGLEGTTELHRVELANEAVGSVWSERLGGTSGATLWEWASAADNSVRRLLDSVLPISIDAIDGHSELYSLRALSDAVVLVDGVLLDARPLVMIDDGQWLDPSQRKALFGALVDRGLTVGRWYTERHEALDPDEVIGDGEPSRRYELLELENATRTMGGTTTGGRRIRAFEAMLLDVADRRATRPLIEYGDTTDTSFAEHLESEAEPEDKNVLRSIEVVSARVRELAGSEARYADWIDNLGASRTLQTAIQWREIEILIARDMDRPQLELLDLALDDAEKKRRSSSAVRESAWLFLHREFKVPFYFGADKIARLGDHNFDQFLRLGGDLFEEMLALLTLSRRPVLSASAQERIVRKASTHAWTVIPQRRSHGRDIQHVLAQIGARSQGLTYVPKASYQPGVSGLALSMRDRARLLDPEFREKTPGAPELFNALGAAIGHNLLHASLNRRAKGDEWMVLYLNRLLCVRYGLPLGLGGWRPVDLADMCQWLAEPPTVDLGGEVIEEQQLLGFS